ncbi:MAG: TonB-dependent receptor [Terricaulis sp.]
MRTVLLGGASSIAMVAFAAPALAQAADDETIIVTGIRGSLQRAMDIKRDATGVVDAISAEDIGDFPDTNLAESLQRIPGVAIDRVNGEGAQITVRGFGPGFNLVTLNGRTLPTAEITATGTRNINGGGGRSFDFSNLASEGVSGLEVYKTGQSILPSGGIGATVNISTARPLENPGTRGLIGAKAVMDTSVEAGDAITPELSGLFSWTNDSETFGVGLFGSYARRDSGAAAQYVNDWIVVDSAATGVPFSSNGSYVRNSSTTIQNPPGPTQKYAIAQDSRDDFSDATSERLNGQLVVQFRPFEALTLTGDVTYAENEASDLRYEMSNWFATPMDQFIFDTGSPIATAVFMQEVNNGEKDMGFEQANRATRDTLVDYGFNAEWELSDNARVVLDAHTGTAESGGNNPLGHVATYTGMAAPIIASHAVDYRSGFPIQTFTIDDSSKGNDNGVLDVGDLGSQVFRSTSAAFEHQVDEFDARYIWENDNSSFTFGANYRTTELSQWQVDTQQDLGSWGVAFPGDIEQYAPGVVQQFCMACQFDDIPTGQTQIAFKANAVDLWNILAPIYVGLGGHPINETGRSANTVEENIVSYFAQFAMEGEFLGRPARFNAGVRYEDTEVNSSTVQSIPALIRWTADNDFVRVNSGATQNLTGEGAYTHILPNIDFSVDATDDLVLRASFSKTIGRPAYNNLYANVTANPPNRPTVLGGQVTGSSQNPNLLPLESDNFDLSAEWYYGDANYLSVGYFRKETVNFIGQGVVNENLFGLRDVTSGAPGTRSGVALDHIQDIGAEQSEANLFTLSALISTMGVAAGQTEFDSRLGTGGAPAGQLPQGYVDQVLAANDLDPYATATNGFAADPLLVFANQKPLNANEGTIDGWEVAWQHFLGDTGFGVAANYTKVDGDVVLDPNASLSVNQFALVGLSDSANLTLIYENYGISARLAYNWRDTFLAATNQGGDRSGIYVEDYGQYDVSVSYDITEALQVSFEGINLTGEDQRQYHRVPAEVHYTYELSPRYMAGARYRF